MIERFTFCSVNFYSPEQVVRNPVGQPRIGANIDVQPIGCHTESVQAAARTADMLRNSALNQSTTCRYTPLRARSPERMLYRMVLPHTSS